MKRSYRIDYQRTHDIDWFCMIDSVPVHIASNGGLIPPDILARENFAVQTEVYNMPCIFSEDDVVVREEYIRESAFSNNRNFSKDAYRSYVKSFVDMARKGFVSLDRIDVGEPVERSEDERYIVVAYSKNLPGPELSQTTFGLLKEGLIDKCCILNWTDELRKIQDEEDYCLVRTR